MPDFYKQYRFADNDAPVQDWDHFLNIRIGAQIIKDTGDKFEKVADHVFNKVARYYLSNEDIEDKFALLHATNTFTDPQYCTATPVEPYHIVNKEYVDACILTAQVDLSGFARLDRENIWEDPQICNSEPSKRTHLTNKAYVDDRINEIEFDTTSLAKLNSPNVFTAPQSCTVESTAPEHFVTKQYVDDTKTQIIDNISGFVRADLPNTFTATQTFQYTIIVPTPQTDTEAANKLYVDTKVTETQQRLGNFAALDLANTFEKDQTFKGNLIANLAPSQPYHLVNKEYVDAVLGGFQLPDGLASTNVEQTWTASQIFSEPIEVPNPTTGLHAANKDYVDAAVEAQAVQPATIDEFGTVRLTDTIDKSKLGVPTAAQVYEYVKNNAIDDANYAKLDAENEFARNNTFAQTIKSAANVIIENARVIYSPKEYNDNGTTRVWVLGDDDGRYTFTLEMKPNSAEDKVNAINAVSGYNYMTLGYYDDGYGNQSDGLRVGQWRDDETEDYIAGMRVKNTSDGNVSFGVYMTKGYNLTNKPRYPAYLGVSYNDAKWELPNNAVVTRQYLDRIVQNQSQTPTLKIFYYPYVVSDNIIISFNTNGGTKIDPISVKKGQTWGDVKSRVAEPSKAGCKFLGWSVSEQTIQPDLPEDYGGDPAVPRYAYATNTYYVNIWLSDGSYLSKLSVAAVELDTKLNTTGDLDLKNLKCSKVIIGSKVNSKCTIKLRCTDVYCNGCTLGGLELDHCNCYIDNGSNIGIITATNRSYVEVLADCSSQVILSKFSDLNDTEHPITNVSSDSSSTVWSQLEETRDKS